MNHLKSSPQLLDRSRQRMEAPDGSQLDSVIATFRQSRHHMIHQLVRFDNSFTDVFIVGAQRRKCLRSNTNLFAVVYVNELNFKVYSKSSLFQILNFFNAGSVDVQGFVSKFLHR